MATSNYPGLHKALNYALPTLTLLLNSTGLFTGYLSANSPTDAAKMGGFPLSSPNSPTATDRALFRALGARNMAGGLTGLILLGLYGLARWDGLSVASTTIKRCIGVSMLVGVTVGVADGRLLLKYADEVGGAGMDEYREKGRAHIATAGGVGILALGWLLV